MTVKAHDATKLFLQAVFARRYVSERVARLLYKKCCEAVNKLADENDKVNWSQEMFTKLLGAVNEKLASMDLELKLAPDEVTGRRMLCIMNLKSDELAQLATEYTAAEIAFFKALIEEIATAPDESFSISSMVALRQLAKAKVGQGKDKMTRAHGEVLLASFVANGWLSKSSKGRYSLGTRARLELFEYLTKGFEELEGKDHLCSVCDQLVLRGVRCPEGDCQCRIHQPCLDLARKKNRIKTCLKCNLDWGNARMRPIGENALRDNAEDDTGARRRVRQGKASDDENEDEDGERPRRVSRKKGKNARAEDDEDDEDEMEVEQEDHQPTLARRIRRA